MSTSSRNTRTRWLRYHALARTSSMGFASSADAATAAAMDAASSGLPSSAASTWRARNGVGATEPMATRTLLSNPSAMRAPRASETVEISSAGRGPDLRNLPTKSAAGRSKTTAVSNSSGSLTVLPGLTKNRSSGISRVCTAPPRQHASSTEAPSTSRGGIMSPAGEALQRFPPSDAALRICSLAKCSAASTSTGAISASAG